MRRVLLLVALPLFAACSNPTSLANFGDIPSAPPSPAIASVAGLTFRSPTEADLQTLPPFNPNGTTPQTPTYEHRGGIPGVANGNYDYTYSFGAFVEQGKTLALSSVLVCQTPGITGSFPAQVDAAVQPVITKWASDALLDQNYKAAPPPCPGDCGDGSIDPSRTKDAATILQNFGWPLIYTSASRRETLVFMGAADETRVFLLDWVPMEASVATVKIDQATAIQRLEAALEDLNSASWEDRTGVDYVLGTSFRKPQPGDPLGAGNVDGVQPVGELPDNLQWNAELVTSYAGKPMWHLSYYAETDPAATPAPATPGSVVPGGTGLAMEGDGWVDAETGDAIRFTRPYRMHTRTSIIPTPFTP